MGKLILKSFDEKNSSKIYMNGAFSSYFCLPEVESLKMPRGIQNNQLVFSCSPLDFFNDDAKKESKKIEIAGQKLKIQYDSNPFIIIVKE